jgi:Domain of unknown function (DUF4129)
MLLDQLTIALRPRSPWEATDLGAALVRRHARTIWIAWIVVTLPAALAFNVLGLLLGQVWLGWLLLWWIKPAFDRIPLYVLSRAVFGAAPDWRETVRAQWRWGWRGIWPWLVWRRLHPGRSMLLSVDLLEGLTGTSRSARCRVLSRAQGSNNVMLTLIAVHLEAVLSISIVLLGLMFVPVEFLSDSAQAMWETLLENPPLWAQAVLNGVAWIAMSAIEPFFVGAGFGLYLNRRTQLEAWDIELSFRRLAERLAPTAAVIAIVGVLVFGALPSSCVAAPLADAPGIAATQTDDDAAKPLATQLAAQAGAPTGGDKFVKPPIEQNLRRIFADQYQRGGKAFAGSVAKAYADPDLSPKTTISQWQRRHPEPDAPNDNKPPAWARGLGAIASLIAESGLWVLAAILLFLLIRYYHVWMPWLADRAPRARAPEAIVEHAIALPESLPDDPTAAVRALWQQGRPRAALALFYRCAVQRLAQSLGAPLAPGSTEAECLRQSRRLSDEALRTLFARIVRCWQAAAYADRLPRTDEVDALLDAWSATRKVPA